MFKIIILIFLSLINYNIYASENIVINCFNSIKEGLYKSTTIGNNGILFSLYAYHATMGAHWPQGSVNNANELTFGLGYSRSYFSNEFNSEYMIFALGFVDTAYKPQLNAGFTYQKYFNMNKGKNLKFGIGYTPFIFVKPQWTSDFPLIIPGIALSASIKYQNFSIFVTYAREYLLYIKIDI